MRKCELFVEPVSEFNNGPHFTYHISPETEASGVRVATRPLLIAQMMSWCTHIPRNCTESTRLAVLYTCTTKHYNDVHGHAVRLDTLEQASTCTCTLHVHECTWICTLCTK